MQGTTKSEADPNLNAANIKTGITIFGILGTYAASDSGSMSSNIHRDKGTIPWSIVKESVTDRGTAYPNATAGTIRAIPSILKDDDGFIGTSITYVDRTGWGATTCGTTGTIDARIANCAANGTLGAQAAWDGTLKGNAGQSTWKLVTRTGNVDPSGRAREVWRDERTGLLWSSLVSGEANTYVIKTQGSETSEVTQAGDGKYINWCKASGSNNISGNPAAEDDPQDYCDNASYQNTAGNAISACFEGAGFTDVDNIDNNIDSAGKAGLHSPTVSWRLPTKYDYTQAETDGIRFVLQEMGPNTFNYEWSASVYSDSRYYAWIFYPVNGYFNYDNRYVNYAVRCVGR